LGIVPKEYTEEEEGRRQELVRDYLNDYNNANRGKTLMEEHREKQAKLKGGKR
jgi:hypothetical protein